MEELTPTQRNTCEKVIQDVTRSRRSRARLMLLGSRYSFALLYESQFSRELVGRCWDHQRHVSYRAILSPNGQAQCECTRLTQPPVICQHAIGLALLGRMLPLTARAAPQGGPAPQAAEP